MHQPSFRFPSACAFWFACMAATGAAPSSASGQEASARRIVDRAVDLVGGEGVLRSAQRVWLDMMTQWQRTEFGGLPHRDRPSFEAHQEARDYTLGAWRNTRSAGRRRIVNVVRDSVAVTDFGNGVQPLSVAYVDEREELFTYTPDRLLLALLSAPDLEALPDTVIGGERHRRVRALLRERYPAIVDFHAGTGLPTRLRFRASHPADFGLVPWGEMEVEVWYSGWRSFGEISIPTQWDIERVGVPYKRMTVLDADFGAEFAPSDSFAVTEEQRAAYWASSAPYPMHEGIPVPDPTHHAGGLVELGGFGLPSGAAALDEGWLLLGAGQAEFNYAAATRVLAAADVEPMRGVVVADGATGNGGVVRAAREGVPIYAAPAAEPFIRVMLDNAGAPSGGLFVVSETLALGAGPDRVLMAPVDLPDATGSLMLYRPAIGWLWVSGAVSPLAERLARTRASELGWDVRAFGHARAFGASSQPEGGR